MRTKLFIMPLLLILLIVQAAPVPLQAAAQLTAPAQVSAAAASAGLKVLGQIGGSTTASAVANGFVYANEGPGIIKMPLDAGFQPLAPTFLSAVLPGLPRDIKVTGGRVYVAMGNAGLAVLNATDLTLLDVYSGAPAWSLAVGSQLLYAASGNTGITAYAFGSPLVLTQTVAITSPVEYVKSVDVNGLNLYAAAPSDGAGQSGAVLHFALNSNGTLPLVPTARTNGLGINALAVNGAGTSIYAVSTDTFYSMTVALGATPVSQTVTLSGAGVQVSVDSLATPTTAFVAEQGMGLDVVDLGTVSVVSSTATASSANFIAPAAGAPEDTMLYIADGQGGLSVGTWATETTTLDLALTVFQPKPAFTMLAAGTNGQAFAWSNDVDLWTIDTTAPANPSVVGSSLQPGLPAVNALGVFNNGGSLLLPAGAGVLAAYQVISGSVPVSPRSVANTINDDNGVQTVVTGTNAFVADGLGGLATVDLTDSLQLTVTKRITAGPDSEYRNVDVSGHFAYVLDLMSGAGNDLTQTLRIYDIANPLLPQPGITQTTDLLCNVPGSLSPASDLKVKGNFIYLACGSQGVQVVNATTLARIPAAGALTTNALQMALNGNRLYLADGAGGVAALTIDSVTGSLHLDSETVLSDIPQNVAVSPNGTVYVATNDAGLFVLGINQYLIYLPIIRR